MKNRNRTLLLATLAARKPGKSIGQCTDAVFEGLDKARETYAYALKYNIIEEDGLDFFAETLAQADRLLES